MDYIGFVVILLLALLACYIMARYLKPVLFLVINSVLGVGVLFLMNYLTTPYGFKVGVNLVTTIVLAVLGFPGFIMLVLTNLLI